MTNKSILLIEDDHDIQVLLRSFFKLEGFNVISAFNGKEALNLLSSNLSFQAILLDLMMPVMDGYEFLEAFTSPQNAKLKRAPVILLSASTDADRLAKERGLSLVKKPIDLRRLLAECLAA